MKRVLIMEDNLSLASEWRDAFQLNKAEVVLTKNADEAIAQLEAEKFDLVITDLFVKDARGGLHVLVKLNTMKPEGPPSITVTGYSYPSRDTEDNHYLRQAKKLGATATIQKPFRPLELVMLAASIWESS